MIELVVLKSSNMNDICKMKPFILTLLFSAGVSASTSVSEASNIQKWVEARCGMRSGSAIWAFSGTISDPMNGRKICDVDGLELVRILARPDDSKMRRNGLVSKDLDNSFTIMSRKLFCYKDPGNPNELVSSIKLTPNAPRRTVPLHQAISLYDTVTAASSQGDESKIMLHTEFPNGNCYWGVTEPSSSLNPSETMAFEWNIFTTKRSKNLPEITEGSSNNDIIISPKRSSLIQFGSKHHTSSSRFGARETYSYSIPLSHVSNRKGWFLGRLMTIFKTPVFTMKYTRYGEGPPWIGPGKFVSLELKGQRVQSADQISPLLMKYTSQIPFFMSVGKGIETDEDAVQAIQTFRTEGLQHWPHSEIKLDSWKGRLSTVWRKVQAASMHKRLSL
jgi:hypothetical protein